MAKKPGKVDRLRHDRSALLLLLILTALVLVSFRAVPSKATNLELVRHSTPTITPTNTPISTRTPIPTITPTNTPISTHTPISTILPTNTPIQTHTSIPTISPTNTPISTHAPISTIAPTNTPISTHTPAVTPTPIPTHTPTPTVTPTPTPTPLGRNVIGQDSFQRANQTLWGTTPNGQAWTGDANTLTNFSIVNGTAQIASGSRAYNALLGSPISDVDMLFTGSISGFNDSNLGSTLRWVDTDNWYKAYIDGNDLVIRKDLDGKLTYLTVAPFTASTNTLYTIRFQAIGTILKAKVWPTGSSEPTDWMAITIDSAFPSGLSGLRIQVKNGAMAIVTSFQAKQVPSTLGPIVGQDLFQRANQALWGTASDGQVWSKDANTAPNFSIVNNTAQIASGNQAFNAILGKPTNDAEVLFSGSISNFNSSNLGATLHWIDTNNWYKAYIDGNDLVIQRKVNGVATVLTKTAFAAGPNTSYLIRFQVVGANLSAKAWSSDRSEPTDWMATTTDNTFSSGFCGLRIQVANGTTATVTSFRATQIS